MQNVQLLSAFIEQKSEWSSIFVFWNSPSPCIFCIAICTRVITDLRFKTKDLTFHVKGMKTNQML